MIRAAIYLRVSTDQQVQEGDSIPAQLDALTRYVNDKPDMILAGEYIDEGISGRKADRDELVRLLADVQDGKIDTILFTKLDRWFRSVRHYTATQEILDKHGVTWTAIWEPIYDTTTAAGRLIVNQMMSIAQFEAENTSQRIRAVMEYKITQGEVVTGTVPIGYQIRDKHLVIVPEEAELVRKVFTEYSITGSINAATRLYNRTGTILTKRGIRGMLTNRKYIGEHRGNTAYCPPIVDKALFDDVQRKISMNVSASCKHVNIFRGILICGCCGRKMAAVHRRNQTSYRCPKYYVPPRRCTNRHVISERVVEQYLIDQLPTMAMDVIAKEREERQQVDTSKQVAALDRKLDRLKELYLAELITIDEYKRDRADLDAQKAALQSAAEPPKKDLSALRDFLAIKDLHALIRDLSPEDRRYLWRGVVKEIRFFDDRHLETIV